MQGTRLPDAVMGEPGPGWDAWGRKDARSHSQALLAPPGSYMKVTSPGPSESVMWWIVDPCGVAGTITSKHHAITEFADGTITVSPSIAPAEHNRGGWHGWLREGVWESV